MSIRFVIMGNVDNGKSTLAGSLLIESGHIKENEIAKAKEEAIKNKKNTFWLAYLLDIDEMERERGITLGYTIFEFDYNGKQMLLIDVPGHKNLVQEMVMGSSLANVALLVLSAKQGEYEAALKGQAMEHISIAKGMGLSTLIVTINKIDESTEEEIDKIQKDFSEKIKKINFKKIIYIPVSAYLGINVKKVLDLLVEIEIKEPIIQIYNISKKDSSLNVNVSAKIIFTNIPSLITIGFKCIAHSRDQYFNVEIIDIKNGNNNFVTKNNSIEKNGMGKVIDITMQILDHIDNISSNIILRFQDQTIGLAKLIPQSLSLS